ncbi:MAG: hypothetical protein RLZ98_64 [Pseudomonadota bacterium]|jgi:DNA ligase-associated metallophosphoesterase
MLVLKPEEFDLRDFHTQPVAVSGRTFLADQSGALYWPGEKVLLVADLHLEKGSSFAAKGQMLPPYDTRDTLIRLAEVIDRYDVASVVALGDSCHDCEAADRISEDDLSVLRIMQEDREWIWITGNHDPEVADRLGGTSVAELQIDGMTLRHVPRPGRITHEIAGHLHPAARLSMYGTTLRRPCFIANGRRLVLPAFGTFTGGLNVLDEAFLPLFGNDGFSVWMLGHDGLYPVATRQLVGD